MEKGKMTMEEKMHQYLRDILEDMVEFAYDICHSPAYAVKNMNADDRHEVCHIHLNNFQRYFEDFSDVHHVFADSWMLSDKDAVDWMYAATEIRKEGRRAIIHHYGNHRGNWFKTFD